MDFEAGSLIEPTACVVKSLRRGGLSRSETVAVVGLGIMGQLHVVLAKDEGATVIGIDRVPFRLQRARELGADAVVDVSTENAVERVREQTAGAMADVVVVGPGSIEAMQDGIELAGPGARVVLFTTSRPEERLSLSPFRLYFDEVSIVPSYSCGPDDTRRALDLIGSGRVPLNSLVTHRFPLDRVADAIKQAARVNEALKTLIVFE